MELLIEEILVLESKISLEKREPDEHPAAIKKTIKRRNDFLFKFYKPSLKNLGSSKVRISDILCESSNLVADDSLNLANE